MPKTRTTHEERQAYFRRLSVVFAAEIRITIVSELFQREMSPKQFYEEFGGGSLPRASYHFQVLLDSGWLRQVRTVGPGGPRRGGRETFYRATELPIFDNETWAIVPYSVRVAFSWRTFRTLAKRVHEAACAKTLDARPEGQITAATIDLDELGWERVLAAVDGLFESLFEEQSDARLRIFHSGEKPMVVTVALLAIEAPVSSSTPPRARRTPMLVSLPKEPPETTLYRISRVFSDELCLSIVAEANAREISAPLFHSDIGGDSIELVRRRFKMLEKVGWLLQVGEKTGGRRRGGTEQFFRATAPAVSDIESWAVLPPGVKPTFSWGVFGVLSDRVKEAISMGTLEARLDNHLTWTPLWLDQKGWENVAKAIDDLLALIKKEQRAAKRRMTKDGGEPIPTTVGLAAFESPKSVVKEP